MKLHDSMIGERVLVTTDGWFYGRDGRSYRGVWGVLHGIYDDKETLGIKTNARSANWYAQVGNMLVAGCQIHYATLCPDAPPALVREHTEKDGQVLYFQRPSAIYHA